LPFENLLCLLSSSSYHWWLEEVKHGILVLDALGGEFTAEDYLASKPDLIIKNGMTLKTCLNPVCTQLIYLFSICVCFFFDYASLFKNFYVMIITAFEEKNIRSLLSCR
jgi:hypothetical protein